MLGEITIVVLVTIEIVVNSLKGIIAILVTIVIVLITIMQTYYNSALIKVVEIT